ncbi:MAG: hypothetical protein FJW27_13380 [Acidimicrobiia bacterium]|nr:hypothetical protein [Acidimicrobiia bacterium]
MGRAPSSLLPLAGVAAFVCVWHAPTSGQAPSTTGNAPQARAHTPPRTADGHPDLQGVYNVATLTPVERPDGLPLVITEEEARRLERTEAQRVQRAAEPSPVDRPAPVAGAGVGGYNNFWIDRGDKVIALRGERRSSLIVDPPDGKIPAQIPEAIKRNASRPGLAVRPTADAPESAGTQGVGAYDDPEIRPLGERCLLGFGSTSGPPTLPNYFYNNLKQIVQTKDTILIFIEMVHDARIVRMNQPHLPPNVRKWMGDSVGRWEGDTLVVDTTNFTDKTRFRGSTDQLHVVERLTPIDANTILYQFTVEDPKTWTRPWSGEYPWLRSSEQIYEYACHEANYAMMNIMSGARFQEKLDRDRSASPR